MSKIARKKMAHFIDAAFGGDVTSLASAEWYRLGKDLEEFNVELNPDTSVSKNILGESTFTHNGYEPSSSVDPYYAEEGDALFEKLQEIVDERADDDTLLSVALEVHMWEGLSSSFAAYAQACYVVPTSYGGDTSGYQIPFELHYVGERVKGTYDPSQKKFTPAS